MAMHWQTLPHRAVAATIETVRASGSPHPAAKLAALVHVVQNTVEVGHARSDLLERRRLVDDWLAYLAR